MDKFEGTTGPWVVDVRGGCVAVYQDGRQEDTNGCHCDDDRNIAYSNKGAEYDAVAGYWNMDEKTVRDLTLIAAAPELLEALQKAVDVIKAGPNVNYLRRFGAVNKAHAAINKALGK